MWVPLDPTPDNLSFSTAMGLAAPLGPVLGLCHLAALWAWPGVQSGDRVSEDGALVLQLPYSGCPRVQSPHLLPIAPLSEGEGQGVWVMQA